MCFGSRKSDSGEARSRELDRMIRQDERRISKEVKLLLLGEFAVGCTIATAVLTLCNVGAGESGKSTILKQMKLIYSQGFSKSERLDWKPVVFSNIIQSFRTIQEAMTELHYEFDNGDNEVGISNVSKHCQQPLIV